MIAEHAEQHGPGPCHGEASYPRGPAGPKPSRKDAMIPAPDDAPGLGEAELALLQDGVPEGGDDDESVSVPLGGLPELQVERLSGRRDYVAIGRGNLAV